MRKQYVDDIKLPDCSLRYHKSEVTFLLSVEWPKECPTPILISGDASGVLVFWNTLARRPIITYNNGPASQVIAVQSLRAGLIAVLFKDHSLRFLELSNDCIEGLAENDQIASQSSISGLKEVYKIPVNTLNFANFLLQEIGDKSYRLICTNTQDSEAIDIYTFNLSKTHSLKRIYKGVNFGSIVEKIPNELPGTKANKLGIVMRFLEREGDIYCGFESGYIIGFRLYNGAGNVRADNSPASDAIELVYISSAHYPDPVLDLSLDNSTGKILSTSTTSEIGVHQPLQKSDVDISKYISDESKLIKTPPCMKLSPTIKMHMPVSKISHVIPMNGHMLISSWIGIALVMNDDGLLAKFAKSKSSVPVTDSCQGTFQGQDQAKKDLKSCKISALAGISSAFDQDLPEFYLKVANHTGQRRRVRKFYESPWCVVGYDDGSIALYRVESNKKELDV